MSFFLKLNKYMHIFFILHIKQRASFVWPWKSIHNLFPGPMFGKIQTKLLLIRPPWKILIILAVNSLIAQSHYFISNDDKAKLCRKFHGNMMLFASAFAKPMKIQAHLFLFNKLIKCFAFLFMFCFYVYFSSSYESCSNSHWQKVTQSNL